MKVHLMMWTPIVILLFLVWNPLVLAQTAVVRGELDVSQLSPSAAVTLRGDWLAIPNRLLTDAEVLQWDHTQGPYERVDFQNIFELQNDQPLTKTYLLKLRGLRLDQAWALSSTMILSATKVTLVTADRKSTPLWQLGQFTDQGGNIPTLVFCCKLGVLPAWQGDAWLVVHIEVKKVDGTLNFKPTFLQPPVLGPASLLQDQYRWHGYEVFFVIGLYFLLSLNSLSLFLQRREDKASLYLAGFGLALIQRYVGTEGVFYLIFGSAHPFDETFNLFALHAALSLIMLCLLQFQHHTFPGIAPRLGRLIIVSLLLLSSTLPFILSGPWLLMSWISTGALQVSAAFFCVYIAIRAALQREEGSILGLCGLGLATLAHFNDLLVITHVYEFVYLGHFGLAGMMFFQALITGKRFASTYERTKQLSAKLNESNLLLEHKVEEKTRDIKSILRSIRQGILLIDRADGTIGEEHSHYLKKMLETHDIAGRNIMDLCFSKSNIKRDDLDQLRNSLAVIIHEDELAFDMNSSCLPQEITRRVNGETQILELEWNPVLDGHSVDKLLLVMRDVTELRCLKNAAANQEREMHLMAQVINIPADRFTAVTQSIERLLDSNFQTLMRYDQLNPSAIDHLYRNIHTIKGITRSYQLHELTEMIHLAEERYKDLKAQRPHGRDELFADIKNIRGELQTIKHLNYTKLGRQQMEERFIQVDKTQLDEYFRQLTTIDLQILKAKDRQSIEALLQLLKKVVYTPLHKVLESQIKTLPNLASSLQKAEPIIDIVDPGVSLNRDSHEFLNHVFSHLIRNALDHGIETPNERIRKGKDPRGTIHIEMTMTQDMLSILMSDDGKGIQLNRVWQKAVDKGLLAQDQTVTAIEVARCILEPGFSTTDKLTDISGRGMGLDAVVNFLEEQGGRLELLLDDPQSQELETVPLEFLITIPRSHYQVVA